MDDDNDGGVREWEENRFRRADEDARLLEEHRQWMQTFNAGLTTTNVKNDDNETNTTKEKVT